MQRTKNPERTDAKMSPSQESARHGPKTAQKGRIAPQRTVLNAFTPESQPVCARTDCLDRPKDPAMTHPSNKTSHVITQIFARGAAQKSLSNLVVLILGPHSQKPQTSNSIHFVEDTAGTAPTRFRIVASRQRNKSI